MRNLCRIASVCLLATSSSAVAAAKKIAVLGDRVTATV